MKAKYYTDRLKRFALKAYVEDDLYVLEMISLVPKYRKGYHVNPKTVRFDTAEKANKYFKKVKESRNLKMCDKVLFMANGHLFI